MAVASGAITGWALVLAAARVAPVVLVAPAAAGLPLPRVAQGAVALVIAALVASGLGDAGVGLAALPMAARALVLVREALVGTVLGLAAAVPLLAASTAGGWLSTVSGAGADDGPTPWGPGLGLLAAAVFFAIGGHLAAVSAVGLSYQALPVGAAGDGAMLAVAVDAGAAMLAAAVALAAPVLVTALVVALAVAAVERVAGLAAPLVPELAVRRLAIVLAMAAAVLAIAIAVAGQTRALPAALAHALARLTGG